MLHRIRAHDALAQPAGWTLVEMLIALSVAIVGTGMAVTFLTTIREKTNGGDQVAELQQGTRNSLEWLVRGLKESAPESIVIAGDNQSAIAFASARDESSRFVMDAYARPIWQQAVVYYLKPGTTDLYRYATPKLDWTSNLALSEVVAAELGEKVCSHITQLRFAWIGTLLEIHVDAQQETEVGSVTNRLSTHVAMRNHL